VWELWKWLGQQGPLGGVEAGTEACAPKLAVGREVTLH
jgi:hypothetical protein